ncbi:FimV/HubP family polar landmark protein [Halomonas getboli]|uniref:FimV/HubP family polar landmark protein n=1 Tax=Halomonas getboli TaxID=2935862 RepID=UPI001FFE4988|nr:FimV/HubP family polar landmark protein [Halomonas getboli]MCK2183404.1 tetratricopeptide repeat protein [Halomonas getboli]
MKRTLSLTTLLPLSLFSPLALALGLGNAEVGSTLNAPLRATIPLTDTAGLEAGLLNASVADGDAYRAAGLARTPLAASVDLAIRRRQGRLVLELSTERAVRDPWLDLLLRFDWPGGRQLREVTLLLDPPDYAAMPALVEGSGAVRLATTTSSTSPASTAPARAVSSVGTGDPARVRSGDTLWAVAGRLRPDSGIGMNQMMLALVQANPEVFPSGNINEMRAGFTLTVPSRETIAARSPARAAELVQAMNSAWARRGGGAPAPVPLGAAEPAVAEAPAPEASADEAAVASLEGARDSSGDAAPRLTLLTDEEVAAGLGGDGVDVGSAGGGVSAESGEAGSAEEGASPTSPGAAERIDPEVLAAIAGRGGLTDDERLLRLERRFQQSRAALAEVQAERDALKAEVGGLREELDALRDRVAALAAGGAGIDAAGAGGVAAPESGVVDDGQTRPWWGALYQGAVERPLVLGGVAIALLLALWGLVRRRRDDEATTPSPAAFGENRVIRPPGEPATPDAGGEAVAAPARSVRAGMPEAEAISEADIFIAYGRYDQARELLEAGVAREPERDDLRLKLMRVQLEQGDRAAAEAQAERLRASQDDAVRREASRLMGRPSAGAEAAHVTERAVFSASDERPPRLFEERDESPEAASGKPTSSAAPEDLSRYRPPEIEPSAEAEPGKPPESDAADESSSWPVPGSDEQGDQADEPEPTMPQVSTRQKEDGSRIIDYRPPTLEPAVPREETPSQPEVEFTSGEDAEDGARDVGDPSSWDVEEVAFPPLPGDNDAPDDAAPAADPLDEARHLIEVGEVREARVMLERFLEASDDAAARQEARDLLDRHQP